MVPRRGLADTNEQVFEIFVTPKFRDVFDKIYRPTEGETSKRVTMLNRLGPSNLKSKLRRWQAVCGPIPEQKPRQNVQNLEQILASIF